MGQSTPSIGKGSSPEERLIERLVEAAEADARVVALLLYGSRAGGTWDAHSDVDIGLVATQEAYEAVVDGARNLVASLGEPLFLESFGDAAHLHAIFAEGAELELMVQRESDLDLDLPHRVLLDRMGLAGRHAGGAAIVGDDAAEREQVRRLLQWFWHDVGHVITALAREQPWWAHGQLEQLRGVCIDLARLDAGVPLEEGEPYWKVDEALRAEVLGPMAETIVPLELEPMRSASLALIDTYRELARPLTARHGLPYPDRLDALLTGRLEALQG
jgi:predicted nucleotidyltransferase